MTSLKRRMRDELGRTPNCDACDLEGVWGHGKRHTAACKRRRDEWLKAQEAEPKQPWVEPNVLQEQMSDEVADSGAQPSAPGASSSSSGAVLPPESVVAAGAPVQDAEMESQDVRRQEPHEEESPRKKQDVGSAKLLEVDCYDSEWEEKIIQEIYCDISGEIIPDDEALRWQKEEVSKIRKMGTFIEASSLFDM